MPPLPLQRPVYSVDKIDAAHKPSLEARGRAFRFVLAHVEVDVVAPTVAVREHWLLACRSLPLGGAFVGRVSVATAYEIE